MTSSKQVLFIDAYDSFSENIAALLQQLLPVEITVIRSDWWTICARYVNDGRAPTTSNKDAWNSANNHSEILPGAAFRLGHGQFCDLLAHFDAVVVGPGPGDPRRPEDLGIISCFWEAAERCNIPVLGICLGFQSLCLAYGATVTCLSDPCHGHAEEILHTNQDIFSNIGQVVATNYHSLEVKLDSWQKADPLSRPPSAESSSSGGSDSWSGSRCLNLRALAWTARGTLMATRHVRLPFWGLQFHPESCKSNSACHDIIRGWWQAALDWSTRTGGISSAPFPILSHLIDGSSKALRSARNLSYATGLAETHGLLSALQRFTESSGSIIQCHTFKLSGDMQYLSQLCHTLSPTQATVMLESTKKGRHCIYAMPSPATFRLEYFQNPKEMQLGTIRTSQSARGTATRCVSGDGSYCSITSSSTGHKSEVFATTDMLDDLHKLILSRMARGGHRESPFWGGFLGYFSYEMGLETLNLDSAENNTHRQNPDISLLWTERSVVVDKLTGTVHVQSMRKDDSAWISDMTQTILDLFSKGCPLPGATSDTKKILESARIVMPDEQTYKEDIRTCQSHLRAGSSYELCLTTEAQIILSVTPLDTSWLLYQNLQQHNPAPFAAYLRLGSTTVLSSSPEQFLMWDRKGTIDMIPMKGTVSKADPSMTLRKATEILASPKESAENLMIADLIRHDLYSTVGSVNGASVQVVRLCHVVEHETVFQLVSHIRAQAPIRSIACDGESGSSSCANIASEAEKQKQVIDYGHKALRHCTPPGSMTGAPKKRSCEILCELEGRRRDVYSGILGFLDVGGAGSFNVCIRTAFSHHDEADGEVQTWHVGAGGAITVLSDVDSEWEEMQTKLRSVLRAFQPHE